MRHSHSSDNDKTNVFKTVGRSVGETVERRDPGDQGYRRDKETESPKFRLQGTLDYRNHLPKTLQNNFLCRARGNRDRDPVHVGARVGTGSEWVGVGDGVEWDRIRVGTGAGVEWDRVRDGAGAEWDRVGDPQDDEDDDDHGGAVEEVDVPLASSPATTGSGGPCRSGCGGPGIRRPTGEIRVGWAPVTPTPHRRMETRNQDFGLDLVRV